MTEASIGLPKRVKATAALIGTLAAISIVKGAQQSPPTPTIEDEHAQMAEYRKRPALAPIVEVKVEKKTWLELLTKNPEEQEAAEKLIELQMPRVRGIAIDPATRGPSPKFEQLLNNVKRIDEEENNNGLPRGHLLAKLLIEGWLDDSLTADAAREVGLRVHGEVDERKIPSQYIKGMARYLAKERRLWDGRIDVALASFNAGRGAIANFVYRYALAHKNVLPKPTIVNFTAENNPYAKYLQEHYISIYKLLTDPSVTPYLEEEHEIYIFRVAAAIKYLVDNNYLQREFVRIKIPELEEKPTPRTDRAVI